MPNRTPDGSARYTVPANYMPRDASHSSTFQATFGIGDLRG